MSSGYLLDTSALSLIAPGRSASAPAFAAWIEDHAGSLYLSAITVAEIEQGIRKLQRGGKTARVDALSAWLDGLIAHGGERILAFDARVAREAGALSDRASSAGRHPGFADVAIAATALVFDLHILTCNGKHFAPLGVAYSDPRLR